MAATGDQTAAAGILAALRKGPLDVVGLLEVLRPVLPRVLGRHEGAFHAVLHRLFRRGEIRIEGLSERGLARYAITEDDAGADEVAVAPPDASGPFAQDAIRMASPLRREADRARVAADLAAHLESLQHTERKGFGSQRSVRHLLRRVDRGRPTVCFATNPLEGLQRFVLHEGVWILAAVVVFFVVRAFLAEVFVIPSSSMVPTLLPRDRVVVFKPGGSSMPDRWAIMTFVRGGTTYVKRAVGLGGDALALVDGDVYVDGEIVVKPDRVREALRFPYQQWDLEEEEDLADWARTEGEEGAVTWSYAGPELWSAGILHPRRPGSDVHLRDAYAAWSVERGRGEAVTLAFDFAGEGQAVTLELRAEEVEASLTVRGPSGDEVLSPRVRGTPLPPALLTLSLSHVDGVVRASVGNWVWQAPVEVPPGLTVTPRLEASGPGSRPRRLALDKDIHYSLAGQLAVPGHVSDEEPGSYAYEIPPGHVFFLGDNTHDSRDSRYRDMGAVPVGDLIGPVGLRIWPLSRLGVVR